MTHNRPNPVLLLLAPALIQANLFAADANWVVNDGDWNIASNWDLGSVPSSGDHAIIDVLGSDITVTQSSGNTVIRSLTNQEHLSIQGGSFKVTGPSSSDGSLTVNRATLIAEGSTASLTGTGAAHLSNGTISARSGGTLELNATAFVTDGSSSTNVLESRTNGQLILSLLATITATGNGRINLEAESGGQTIVSALTSINNPNANALNVTATGAGSALNVASLTAAQAVKFTVSNNATIDVGQLADANNSQFLAQSGSLIALPQLTNYEVDGAVSTVVWEANGSGAVLDVPSLNSISLPAAAGRLTIEAQAGGTTNLGGLLTVDNPNNRAMTFSSTGSTSSLNLAALTTSPSTKFTTASQATMDLGQLSSADNSEFVAQSGTVLAVPRLMAFTTDGSNSTIDWEANGSQSRLDLQNLATITSAANGRLNVSAEAGGTVNLDSLTTVANPNNNSVAFLATGGNSALNLPVLTSAPSSKFTAAGQATMNIGQLSAADNSEFVAQSGSTLALAQLTSFTTDGSNSTIDWDATGYQAMLDMQNLTTVTSAANGRLNVSAEAGGAVRLDGLVTVENPNDNAVTFVSTGEQSAMNLSALRTAPSSKFTAASQGTMNISQLNSADNSEFVASGSTLAVPVLTTFTTDGSNSTIDWEATGYQSKLDLQNLATITSAANGRLNVSAESGATVDLRGLTSIVNPEDNNVTFLATGGGSHLDLRGLIDAQATRFTAASQATIDLTQLASATNSAFAAHNASGLSVPISEFETNGGAGTVLWESRDFGSNLAFPALTNVTSEANGRLTIEARSSGTLNLPSLENVSNPNGNNVILRATGFGSVLNVPALTQYEGSEIDVAGGGAINLTTGTLSTSGTEITIRNDGSAIVGGTVVLGLGSSLVGSGTIAADVTNSMGEIDPGVSASDGNQITIDGDLIQESTGRIKFDIDRDNDFDELTVSGAADLAGVLELAPTSSYRPSIGDLFRLIDSGAALSGVFETIEGIDISSGYSFAVTYGMNEVVATVALPGDANLDGFVNGQDFVAWNTSKFTASSKWTDGDFNGDGFIDGQDFVIWNNFKFQAATPASVPEPTGAAMWFTALLVVASIGGQRSTSAGK